MPLQQHSQSCSFIIVLFSLITIQVIERISVSTPLHTNTSVCVSVHIHHLLLVRIIFLKSESMELNIILVNKIISSVILVSKLVNNNATECYLATERKLLWLRYGIGMRRTFNLRVF